MESEVLQQVVVLHHELAGIDANMVTRSGGALAHGTAAAKTGGQEGSDEGEVRPEGGRRRVEEEV